MNIITKFTWMNMKKNRNRTIASIIGVIVSATMFTAILTLLYSAYSAGKTNAIENTGNYHLSISEKGEYIQSVQKDKRCRSMVYGKSLGFAPIKTEMEEKPYLYLLQVDQGFIDTMSLRITEGRFPEKENEICLPNHYLYYGGKKIEVGQTVTLEVGTRLTPDGKTISKNGVYNTEESLENIEKRNYVLTGYYEQPYFELYSAPGYTTLVGGAAQSLLPKENYDAYLLVSFPMKNFESFREQLKPVTIDLNYDLLMFSGVMAYADVILMVIGFAGIFAAIVFIGSVSLIYSVFSISVSERTKQFGILSSIGATSAQIRRSVLTEGLILCLFGVPIGVFAGVTGIGITLHFCGDIIGGIFGSGGGFPMKFNFLTVLLAMVITVSTVLVSAFIPAIRASHLTAIEAIRMNRDIKVPKRKRKKQISPRFYKIFGVPAALVRKYFSRSKKKYRNTIISLALSVTLFVAAGSFTTYMLMSVDDISDVSELGMSVEFKIPKSLSMDTLEKELLAVEGVEKVAFDYTEPISFLHDSNSLTDEYKEYVKTRDFYKLFSQCPILYISDGYFDSLLPPNIDKAPYYDKENPLYLVQNHSNWRDVTFDEKSDEAKIHVYDYNILKDDVTKLSIAKHPKLDEKYYVEDMTKKDGKLFWIVCQGTPESRKEVPVESYEIQIGAKTNQDLWITTINSDTLTFLRPLSTAPESVKDDIINLSVDMNGEPKEIENKITSLLGQMNIQDPQVYNYAADQEMERSFVTVIRVFAYGFIILISIMAAVNVFNTLSTNIMLRKRDFAMLQSIGMTKKGIFKMMRLECLLYGSISLLIGVPLSLLASYGIFKITDAIASYSYQIPWSYLLIAAAAVFVVVFTSMLYAYSKLKKTEIMEAVRGE